MRGVVFTGNRKLSLMEFDDPTPGPREVVLEIKASGMCGSDLQPVPAHAMGGQTGGIKRAEGPVIAGHEPCGVVVAVGSAVERAGGARRPARRWIITTAAAACASIAPAAGRRCASRGRQVYGSGGNGAHAKYMKVPVSTLVTLPDSLSFEIGAAISCGTGTAYGALAGWTSRATRRSRSSARARSGCRRRSSRSPWARASSRSTSRPSGANWRRQFGAHEVLNPMGNDPVAAIRELTHGEGAHETIDCSSNPEARAATVRAVRTWGTACFVGEGGQVTLDVSPDMLRRQVTLMASWTFSKNGQADCAEFVADRKIAVDKLFTHHWKLEQAEEAYKLFDTQTTGKGVFLM